MFSKEGADNKKYYKNFSILDWAFLFYTFNKAYMLYFYYGQKETLINLYTGLGMEISATDLFLVKYSIPSAIAISVILYVLALLPQSELSVRRRKWLIFAAFLVLYAGDYIYAQAAMGKEKRTEYQEKRKAKRETERKEFSEDLSRENKIEESTLNETCMEFRETTSNKSDFKTISRKLNKENWNKKWDLHATLLEGGARMVPYFRCKDTKGFKIFAIRENGPFFEIGLENGDVLLESNGKKIDGIEAANQLISDLLDPNEIELKVLRDIEVLVFKVSFQ